MALRFPTDGTYELVKHYVLKEAQSAKGINAFVTGEAGTVLWSNKDYRQCRTALQIMLANVAGLRVLFYDTPDAPHE